jgi:hypothetical protein
MFVTTRFFALLLMKIHKQAQKSNYIFLLDEKKGTQLRPFFMSSISIII